MRLQCKHVAIAIVVLFSQYIAAQSVTLAPSPQFISLLQNGQPNSFGCVFTFASGTNTPLSTNTDYISGTLNSNPVLLTAGGTAGIWFQTGSLYRVVVTTTDNAACSKPLGSGGSTIYTVDGVNSSLLNTANTWDASQTFTATTYFTMSDLQLVFGTSGSQTTLDIPPTAGNYILHGPPITGNDTLLNKNSPAITTPVINGCGMTYSPGTYVCVPNNGSTATVLNGLAVFTGAPTTATVAPTSNAIVMGIVTAGAGITGNATVEQSGIAPCIFDGATTAGDYVQSSTTTAGDCHDAGASYSAGIGRVLSTNSGAGTYNIDLFGPGFALNVLGQAPLSFASYAVGPGAGTSPSNFGCEIGVTCFDNGGEIVISTGSSPTTGTIITVSFAGTHNNNACTLWPGAGAAVALSGATQVSVAGNAGTAFTISSGTTPLTASTTYLWNYTCTFH
jgi:hypothetical protein